MCMHYNWSTMDACHVEEANTFRVVLPWTCFPNRKWRSGKKPVALSLYTCTPRAVNPTFASIPPTRQFLTIGTDRHCPLHDPFQLDYL